jgi:cytochrome c-type biogenesis protein CcmH
LIVGLSLLAALALVNVASAQDGTESEITDDEVNDVASELYCPICENVPLDVCPTQACADWRAEIRELLEQGYTDEEVQEYFVDRYGVRVMGEPPKTGFTSLVWILPYIGLGIGLLVLGIVLYRMSSRPTELAPAAADGPAEVENQDAAYVARLEQELEDFTP